MVYFWTVFSIFANTVVFLTSVFGLLVYTIHGISILCSSILFGYSIALYTMGPQIVSWNSGVQYCQCIKHVASLTCAILSPRVRSMSIIFRSFHFQTYTFTREQLHQLYCHLNIRWILLTRGPFFIGFSNPAESVGRRNSIIYFYHYPLIFTNCQMNNFVPIGSFFLLLGFQVSCTWN